MKDGRKQVSSKATSKVFHIIINLKKIKFLKENIMVAILIIIWHLSINEGITRKHY